MNPIAIGLVVFACTFGGALAGMWFSAKLPTAHMAEESKGTVKLCVGLIATMTALVLGLVTASAKSSFESMGDTIRHAAADVMTLDRALARFGPEATPARAALARTIEARLELTWRKDARDVEIFGTGALENGERTVEIIRSLQASSEEQRDLRDRAIDAGETLLEARWGVLGATDASVLAPFITVLVFWLTVTFASFGLFAPRNATVTFALLVSALSVAGAVFLVLELDGPFTGLIRVSPEPLRHALALVGQ